MNVKINNEPSDCLEIIICLTLLTTQNISIIIKQLLQGLKRGFIKYKHHIPLKTLGATVLSVLFCLHIEQ